MRVLHIATWVASGNPFGGPVTVAENLAVALTDDGHHVDLVAAGPRKSTDLDSTDTGPNWRVHRGWRIVPGARFTGVVSPSMIIWLLRNSRSYDVIHVHAGRDLVTLPACLAVLSRGGRLIVQTHGMVATDKRLSARCLDAVFTRPILRRARLLLALTDYERRELTSVARVQSSRVSILPNGVPLAALESSTNQDRPEFLFCSRLHTRKRPRRFAQAAANLLESGVSANFRIIGSDEGERQAVVEELQAHLGASVVLEDALPHNLALQRVARCDVLVLPSVDEPYPMVVLEAMSLSKPVVITRSCGLANFVETQRAGIVVTPDSTDELEAAMRRLANDPRERLMLGVHAGEAVRLHRSIQAIARTLEGLYQAVAS